MAERKKKRVRGSSSREFGRGEKHTREGLGRGPLWVRVALIIVAFFILRALFGMAATLFGEPPTPVARIVALVLLYAATICFAKAVMGNVGAWPARSSSATPQRPAVILKVIFAGLVMIVSTSVLLEPLLQLFRPVEALPSDGIWGVVAAVLVAPVFEEWLFRGTLQRLIAREMSSPKAVVIASAMFAAAHATPHQMVAALFCGMILGWAYCRTGSLAAAILLHALNNLLACLTAGMALRGIINNDMLYWLVYAACVVILLLIIYNYVIGRDSKKD